MGLWPTYRNQRSARNLLGGLCLTFLVYGLHSTWRRSAAELDGNDDAEGRRLLYPQQAQDQARRNLLLAACHGAVSPAARPDARACQRDVSDLLYEWYGVRVDLNNAVAGVKDDALRNGPARAVGDLQDMRGQIHAAAGRALAAEYAAQKAAALANSSIAARDATLWRPEPWNVERGMYLWDWFFETYTCDARERVGRVGDGGKWLCSLTRLRQDAQSEHGCVVYSYGVRDDVTFELELIRRTGCTVHAFDPSIHGTTLAILSCVNRA